MASTTSTILLASAILVAAAIYFRSSSPSSPDGGSSSRSSTDAVAATTARTTTTHLHFYMHDEYTGANPTAALIVPGRQPPCVNPNATDAGSSSSTSHHHRRFGDIAVMNNALTEGPGRGSPRVGTAQGFTVRVSELGSVNALTMHLVLEAGEHAGSSLAVSGRVDTDLAVRESVVVGGTGRFRFARGYAHSRSYDYDLDKGGVVEIDVYLLD